MYIDSQKLKQVKASYYFSDLKSNWNKTTEIQSLFFLIAEVLTFTPTCMLTVR